ncbi:probable calcium-binding protein CML23 [Lycium barbarum]|uniref:probable calcium-binding protein CML23 n=1 Tax=Lycium barbarum TaxID=112863 RepID=UPI00293E2139|nr:probable calcium-binding protein CML23 [Lycium barbarum]
MALKNTYRRNVASDGKLEMTLQEFKKWLKRFDTNNDGKISKEELREVIRANGGGWFSRLKGSRGIKAADTNGNGYIDENEFNNLVEFAQRNLGVRIMFNSKENILINSIRNGVEEYTYRRSVASDGKLEMSLQEFKKGLKRFATNNDWKISKELLQEAVRANGGSWFSRLKGRRGIKAADTNGDGY